MTIADGSERRLAPAEVTVSRIANGITAGVFGAIAMVAAIILLLARPFGTGGSVLAVFGVLLLAILFTVFGLIWPPVRHRHVSYRVNAEGIRIRSGVFWRSEVTVPRSRVQHTDISRGPLERAYDLATLIIYTAGTEHSRVSLSGLLERDAAPIRDWLLEGSERHGV